MFEINQTSAKQAHRYGPFIRQYTVKSDEPIEQVAEECLRHFGHQLPPETEWKQNVRIGAAHGDDPAYYFAGYYNLTIIGTDAGITEYNFKITEPFAD